MSKQKNALVFATVFVLGTILGVLGTVSSPVNANMSYFWPAAAIQSVAGILFGVWGALGASLFPSLSNLLTAGYASHYTVWLIPSNAIQAFMPLLVKQIIKFDSSQFNVRTIVSFSIGCVLLPNIYSYADKIK